MSNIVRARGHSVPNATNTAKAVVACPDGIPAYSTRQIKGLKRDGSRLPPTIGRARPIIRLMIVTKRLGTAIAANKKPTRTIAAARTRWEKGVRIGGNAESVANKSPSGHRNQPDFPYSVRSSKSEGIQN